ncbi:MAG: leucyl aminopeptidase, partial [Chloroflexota bacterium]|nr:leucyl aminopeptidase [Chloroflexota bacterium]
QIKGKLEETTLIHTLGKITPQMVMVVGLGKKRSFDIERVRRVAAIACKSLRDAGARKVATVLHGAGTGRLAPESVAQAITEGSHLGLYSFREHLTKPAGKKDIRELLIVEQAPRKQAQLKAAVKIGNVIAEASILARDMVNQPSNFMTPTDMAQKAREVADKCELGIEVLERDAMQELGMGALLGVAQGSQQPPKLIILTYKGNEASDKTLGIIGKGLTFDSGGISLKPSAKMDEMKGDMAGGAAVVAAMQAIGELKPKINVIGLIPATENLPSGTALKPGDVVKAMNGRTIEVLNTDAEGRLILADALSYAKKLGLSPMVDIATLTGACQVALGDICTGAFGNNQKIIDKMVNSGAETGERIWQMPMYDDYTELIKSDIADIKNTGGRGGGAITAAKFLAEFVGNTPWVHLDIAGTFMLEKGRGYLSKGATGIPVRALINLTLSLAEE